MLKLGVMDKQHAISLLGGSVTAAARAIGVTYHAVYRWPPVLPPRIADRVTAALARQQAAQQPRETAHAQ